VSATEFVFLLVSLVAAVVAWFYFRASRRAELAARADNEATEASLERTKRTLRETREELQSTQAMLNASTVDYHHQGESR